MTTSTTMTPEMSALKTRLKTGPTNRASLSLDDAGKKALREDLNALWTGNNVATDGTTRVLAEYIEVTGTRA